MAADDRLQDLLLAWQDSRDSGREAPAEELCRDCPELAPELRRQIDVVRRVDSLAGTASAPAPPRKPARSTVSLVAGAKPVAGFVLEVKLGQGGYGEVWRARGPMGVPVALKLLPLEEDGASGEMRALSFLGEVRHPNLLSSFGTWQRGGWLILAMELAERNLKERLTEALGQGLPGIPREELLARMREAARGIDHLNRKRIQHRDVKPENLLLVQGCVKVADFGLAKLLERSLASNSGAMTPAYAAPEYFLRQTSRFSDQYSLAVTYCELRGGRRPFTGKPMDLMFGHLNKPPDLSMLPDEERPTVARALAKAPDERWPSCEAFVDALGAPGRPATSRRTLWAVLAGLGLLLVLGGLLSFPWWSRFFKEP